MAVSDMSRMHRGNGRHCSRLRLDEMQLAKCFSEESAAYFFRLEDGITRPSFSETRSLGGKQATVRGYSPQIVFPQYFYFTADLWMRKVRFQARQSFYVLYSVQTSCGTHPASYSMCAGLKRSRRGADHSRSSSTEVEIGGAMPPPSLPHSHLKLDFIFKWCPYISAGRSGSAVSTAMSPCSVCQDQVPAVFTTYNRLRRTHPPIEFRWGRAAGA
jgi:hypothetical protein